MIGDDFESAYAGPIAFSSLDVQGTQASRIEHQATLRKTMSLSLYGALPPPPDSIKVVRQPLSDPRAERLLIEMTVEGSVFTVDAALWLPHTPCSNVPLICGLDFVGPIGLLHSPDFPADPNARITSSPVFGANDNRLQETLRGTSAYRWPLDFLLSRGYAVMLSCYGSWVPDDTDLWKTHGLYPLLGCQQNTHPTAALSLWAWAIQRLLDAAATCNEIDVSKISVAGHSRLGKAALWAAANDNRIKAVFANNSGCGGAAPAAHPVGETMAQMTKRFPHWTIASSDKRTHALPFDQHELLSLIAPRVLYLAAAKDDLWSDPIGSYLALKAASGCWQDEHSTLASWLSPRDLWRTCARVANGVLGYHLRPGGHELLPYDWQQFLGFLDGQSGIAEHRALA